MEEDDEDISTAMPVFPRIPSEAAESDWDYSMRRQMQEIIPGVFLGPYAVATKKMLCYLKDNHITHIVCVRHPIEARRIRPNFPDEINYMVIDVAENTGESIIPHLGKVKDFIDNCLKFHGCVLVHGNAGICTSATFVIGYVMETYGLPYDDAHALVQRKRFCVNPSEIFRRQLTEYETIYLARHQASGDHMRPKRPHCDDGTNPESPYKAAKT